MAHSSNILIVGAGAGGLAAACDLAKAGFAVTVLDRAAAEGGKMRQLTAGKARIDAGPTVFTMRWVFEDLFAACGKSFAEAVSLAPALILARHTWAQGGTLDLHADTNASAEAISTFAGAAEGRAYLRFMAECRDIHTTLRDTFMAAQKPSAGALVLRVGNLAAMMRTRPFDTYWQRLESSFADPRLRQVFGRYATYVGSSPYLAPATLMLIAHVEQEGVWLPEGGMSAVAAALRQLAESQGARFRLGADVREISISNGRATGVVLTTGEEIPADAVVFNGDASALAAGLLGDAPRRATSPVARRERSLSAITWCLKAKTRGFALSYHNVFFANDYQKEFDAIFRARTITGNPTVYVCAQDRRNGHVPKGAERLLILVNAPPDGDLTDFDFKTSDIVAPRVLELLKRCRLEIEGDLHGAEATTPSDFNTLFPGTGGALYGQANHSPMASFARPGSASRIRGLYLAGGSAHPGPGVPMAALSGRLAAAQICQDYAQSR